MTEYYPNLFDLDGVAMDAASYERHKNSRPQPVPAEEPAPCASAPVQDALDDVFSAPQDLRQMTAAAIRADEAREAAPEPAPEYRPDTAVFVPAACTEETVFFLTAPQEQLVYTGSGSYRTSGSFRSSGSYLGSGSFRRSSSASSFSGLGGYGLELI